MKKIKKIIIISFLWLFVVTIFGIVAVEAQQEIIFRPQVPIDGFGERRFGETGSTQYIAEYIVAIYRYGISIGAILATVVLMAAGLIWLTSGGSQEKIGQAKNMISGSIIGLVLLFGSYTILNTVNPELVDFHIENIDYIAEVKTGCCKMPGQSESFETVDIEYCQSRGGEHLFNNVIVKKKVDENITIKTCTEKEEVNFCCRCGFGCVNPYSNNCAYWYCGNLKESYFSHDPSLYTRQKMCNYYCSESTYIKKTKYAIGFRSLTNDSEFKQECGGGVLGNGCIIYD